VYWLCSRFTENLSSWSRSMNPLPEVVLSQLVIRAILRQHTMYLKITTMLCQWGSLSPYKYYSTLLRWQAKIFVHIPHWNCINEGMQWFWCVSLLSCLWDYLIVCGFNRTIMTCACLIFFFLRLFGCLCLIVEHWCEIPMMRMIYPSSAGTLACVKSLATMFESVVPSYPNDSQ
jgi:hypothetical protein